MVNFRNAVIVMTSNVGTSFVKRSGALGFAGMMKPVLTSCADHMGSAWARVQTWDGTKWAMASEPYQADMQILKPMIKAAADRYVAEKKLERRDAADCQL